jgi:hypothetical protein
MRKDHNFTLGFAHIRRRRITVNVLRGTDVRVTH